MINQVSVKNNFLCSADDTTLTSSLKNLDDNLSNDINSEILKVNDWLRVNKLSLNIGIIKYMLFSKANKIVSNPSLQISKIDLEKVQNFT